MIKGARLFEVLGFSADEIQNIVTSKSSPHVLRAKITKKYNEYNDKVRVALLKENAEIEKAYQFLSSAESLDTYIRFIKKYNDAFVSPDDIADVYEHIAQAVLDCNEDEFCDEKMCA